MNRAEHRLEAEKLLKKWPVPTSQQEALTKALVHAILATGPERPGVHTSMFPVGG